MVMSWIWTGMLAISLICAVYNNCPQSLAAAVLKGAQAGTELAISIAGSLCLWSGVGKLMDAAGMTDRLSRLLRPVLHRLFPSTAVNPSLSRSISSNVCANLLGLGNAATPMGIQAAKQLKSDDSATDELCRLVVLNTASIQLIPANVAAVRAGLGHGQPFDILPAVWITSFSSAGIGLLAAWMFGRRRQHD